MAGGTTPPGSDALERRLIGEVRSPAMGGALLLVATLGLLGCVGWWLTGALGIESSALCVLGAYAGAWAALVATAALLSVPGWLCRWSLVAAIAALAVVSFVLDRRRGSRGGLSAPTGWNEALADPVVRTLAIAVAVAGIYLAALSFLTTPNDWDGLTYHETRALLWDQQGRVGYVPDGNDPRLNGNPPVSEIGLYLAMLVPRSERFAALPQFIALWASLLAVVLLGRRLGLSRTAAAYGGLVFATLPVILLHGASILNDLVVASFLLAAVVLLAGHSRAELAVGSVALGLALSAKFNAALALPIVLAAVLALVPARRRAASLIACGAGVLLGAPWYVLNLVETGSVDGGLGDTTGQAADHSVRGVLGTLRALVFDIVDTSGLWGSELGVAIGVGAAMVVVGAILVVRGAAAGRALAYGGLLVALVPLLLRAAERPLSYAWRHLWFKLGHEGISLDHGDAWKVLGLPDTSLSWYGAAGAVVILGGVAAAIVGVRRAVLRRGALVLALAPLGLVVVFAFTIVYDPWRGRLAMFAVGLACAVWGWTIRTRWLSVGIAGLCVTTVVLSLVHSYTKPSGLGMLEPSSSRSVWHRDRIDTLTVIRGYDGTPSALRAVEADVPGDAVLAVAAPIDTFLAPLAGPRLSRTLRLVRQGVPVPPDATWLVTKGERATSGCKAAWSTVYADAENGWRLLRRTAPDACGSAVTPF